MANPPSRLAAKNAATKTSATNTATTTTATKTKHSNKHGRRAATRLRGASKTSLFKEAKQTPELQCKLNFLDKQAVAQQQNSEFRATAEL
jgi:hypothetical protein